MSMAKIKIKLGENEIEIDSRDFYVDNQTLGDVIESISKHIPENSAKIVYENPIQTQTQSIPNSPNFDSLNSLDDAETFEPEFDEPIYITSLEVKSKLKILETASFFDSPRSVTETVQKLREYGWAASPLDVSKALTKMAFNREISKTNTDNRNYYCISKQIITN